MANRTAWTAGNLNGSLSWTGLFSSSDLNLMSPGQSVRSTLADITNGTGLDMFMDVSLEIVIAQAATITLGANCALYIMPLLQDGSTYGDNSLPTAGIGGATTVIPGISPVAVFPFRSTTSLTLLAGFAQQVVIPPGSFRCAIQNNTNVSFGGAQGCHFRSYNINLNN